MSMRFRLRRRSPSSVAHILLESLPPVFHLGLLFLLTYECVVLRPDDLRWRLLVAFVVFQIVGNWIFFLWNKSVVWTSPRNFPGYVHRYPANNEQPKTDSDTAELLPDPEFARSLWKECESCDMHVPVRTYHCGHCRRCIYALDHHCYFLGTCVGRCHLRFFIVFCFYAAVGCGLGVHTIYEAMAETRDIYSREFGYYLLPFTTVMYFMEKAESHEVLWVGLMNFGLGALGACTFLFFLGMWSAVTGLTPSANAAGINARVVAACEYNNMLAKNSTTASSQG